MVNKFIDTMWDETPINITQEANFIWSIANKLRGSYMPDKYGDVIIPMTIIRRFECALTKTKKKVVEQYKVNPNYPPKALSNLSGFPFYCVSEYNLAELCNDSDNIAANFKAYIDGFSQNVCEIFDQLELKNHIDKMEKDGCLYSVVKAFSELDLSIETFDSIRMGYIFENLIGRFYQNVDAGQFYTGRDIIKLLVEILMAEGCDDIFDDRKVITVCDQACGTGGMLSTAYNYIKHYNPTVENGSPLFNGDTGSGESQIRRWLLESDLIEAIIALPTDLFYNTGIQTYVWILSKNKRKERKGKVQLINADKFYHKLRKAVGDKKNEISPEDRKAITHLYADFVENEYCKIYKNEEFIYREYSIMQPLQRSYAITEERIETMLQKGCLNALYDEAKIAEWENQGVSISDADKVKYEKMLANKPRYEAILSALRANISDKVYLAPKPFMAMLEGILSEDKKLLEKIANGLSVMDKSAEIQRDKKGEIIYDKESKDTEIVKWDEDIETYMAREVLPHIPDAKWFWEENLSAKKPVIKTGAEIPFTRYFYKYQQPVPSEQLEQKFMTLEHSVTERIKKLFE